jgi:hypothetical protein
MKLHITNNGIDAILTCIANKKVLTFTKVVPGNGDAARSDEIQSPIEAFYPDGIGITAINKSSSGVVLKFVINNAKIDTADKITELGVYIKNPEDESKEILYAYGSTTADAGMYIPASSDCYFEIVEQLNIYVSDEAEVTAVFDSSAAFAARDDLESHVAAVDNPHKVTAEQIGLGSVLSDMVDIKNRLKFAAISSLVANISTGASAESPIEYANINSISVKSITGTTPLVSFDSEKIWSASLDDLYLCCYLDDDTVKVKIVQYIANVPYGAVTLKVASGDVTII